MLSFWDHPDTYTPGQRALADSMAARMTEPAYQLSDSALESIEDERRWEESQVSTAVAAPPQSLEFAARAKVRNREIVRERVFPSKCGRYAVIEVKPLAISRSVEWLAVLVMPNGNECIIGRKRTRESAEQVCIDRAGGGK